MTNDDYYITTRSKAIHVRILENIYRFGIQNMRTYIESSTSVKNPDNANFSFFFSHPHLKEKAAILRQS